MEENMSSRNNEGKIVIILIISLIAFGLGSGIGITVGISQEDPSFEENTTNNTLINVTHNLSEYNAPFNDSYSLEEEELSNNSEYKSSAEYYPEDDSKYSNITID